MQRVERCSSQDFSPSEHRLSRLYPSQAFWFNPSLPVGSLSRDRFFFSFSLMEPPSRSSLCLTWTPTWVYSLPLPLHSTPPFTLHAAAGDPCGIQIQSFPSLLGVHSRVSTDGAKSRGLPENDTPPVMA